MKDALLLLTYLLAKLARLLRPGGARAIAAENLLMRQQLVMIQRSRHRAPNLTTHDRILFGFWSLFLSPRRSPVRQQDGAVLLLLYNSDLRHDGS